MKRILILLAVAAASMMPADAVAQFNLSGALNALFGNTNTQEQTMPQDPFLLIAEQAPSARELVGTWVYDSAEAEYLGDNPLAEFALSKVEDYAIQKIESYGVTRGSFTVQMRRNGTAIIVYGTNTLTGRYTYNPDTGAIAVSGVVNGTSVSCNGYVKLVDGTLVGLVNAKDALAAFTKAYPQYSSHQLVQTVGGVISSFDGIYGAITLTK